MKEQKGQVILILLLIMTVALGLGISVAQRSLVDVSTSAKIEQSQRALSAAEAGVERILRGSSAGKSFEGNMADVNIDSSSSLPPIPQSGRQMALEYPPLSKEEVAHIWFANYNSPASPPDAFYKKDSIDIFWGQASGSENTALEVTIVYYEGGEYKSVKRFFDPLGGNNFTSVICSTTTIPETTLGRDRTFKCKQTVDLSASQLMLMRIRPLYNSSSQPLAVQAVGVAGLTCPAEAGCFLPAQVKVYTSTGTSGQTERKIQVFTLDKVVPFYFDYAIFSAGAISK